MLTMLHLLYRIFCKAILTFYTPNFLPNVLSGHFTLRFLPSEGVLLKIASTKSSNKTLNAEKSII